MNPVQDLIAALPPRQERAKRAAVVLLATLAERAPGVLCPSTLEAVRAGLIDMRAGESPLLSPARREGKT